MTVNASVMWRERYKGNGTQSQWPVPFPFLQPEHVRATLVTPSGAGRALQYNAEYTVSANTERRGGTVGYLVPANHELVVHLDLPYSQEIDLYNNGILDAEVLEYGLDKLTLLCAQLAERVSRAVTVDIANTETPEALCNALLQARDEAAFSAGQAAVSLDTVQGHATSIEQNALAAQTEADRAMGYVDKVEADIAGLEEHLVAVGDAQVARVGEEGGLHVARARAEADRAEAVVPVFTEADKGKGLFVGEQGPEWLAIKAPGLQWRPGMFVSLPGTKLYPNCVWPDRSLVLFADWPELHAEYTAGYLGTVSEADAVKSPDFFVLKADGSGLYLPDIGGLFSRAWRPGEMQWDKGRQAGSYQEDAIRNIKGVIYPGGMPYSHANGTGAFYGGAGGGFRAVSNGAYDSGVVFLDVSRVVPTADENRPQNYAQPIAIYLGRHATEV